MSITQIALDQIEGGGDSEGNNTYRIGYRSYCSDSPETIPSLAISQAVSAATNIDIGTPYASDGLATCRSYNSRCVKRTGKGVIPRWEWETTFEFSSRGDPRDSPSGPTAQRDPVLRPPQISVTQNKTERPTICDRWENTIKNSAGDPIIRQRKWSSLVFKWTKYMDTWDWSNNILAVGNVTQQGTDAPVNPPGFMYSRNYYLWSPAGPYKNLFGDFAITKGMALITGMNAEAVFEGGKQCVKVEVEVSHDSNLFYDVFLDQGFFYNQTVTAYVSASAHPEATSRPFTPGSSQEFNPPTATALPGSPNAVAPSTLRRRFQDAQGRTATPQLLDGSGNSHPGGTVAPQYRSYNYYNYRDWTQNPMGGLGGFFDNVNGWGG